ARSGCAGAVVCLRGYRHSSLEREAEPRDGREAGALARLCVSGATETLLLKEKQNFSGVRSWTSRKREGQHPTCMSQSVSDVRRDVVIANRLLAREGILDAYGHVSVRHPEDPRRFIMSWARAPELIDADDLLEFDADGEPVNSGGRHPYQERFIHAAIFAA